MNILFLAISWGVMGWVILGTVIFLILVAALGRAIAATFPPKPEHMSSFKKPSSAKPAHTVSATVAAKATVPAVPGDISPEILAVISAAVATVLQGQKYAIRDVRPVISAPNIEHLMTEWSMEGRRQVYSSHQINPH